jgi:CheY-like chemotaxis protein
VTHKVLIVDDSKLARMAVAAVLNKLHPDWTWVEASNSIEALELIEQSSPDMAVLDFNMPGKDGLALAQEIRQLDPTINVAVISANRQVEVINRAHAAGATFLPKPLTADAFEDFLRVGVEQAKRASK